MDLTPLLPEILLGALAVAILAIDWFLPRDRKYLLGYFSMIGICLIYIVIHLSRQIVFQWHNHLYMFPDSANLVFTLPNGQEVFQGFVLDGFALFFKKLFLLASLIVFVFSFFFFRGKEENQGEYYALLLFVTLGAFFLVSASDLLMIFVSFELMSIPLYILAGFRKRDSRSNEAGLKYFLIGAVTSAFLAYGISLIYGSLGTLDLRHLVSPGPVTLMRLSRDPVLFLGFLFVLSALAFKIAAVPFHLWAPDVYEGAPTPVTAFLAVVPKIAVIGLLLRIFAAGMPEAMPMWSVIFAGLAALSMTVGNLMAFHQQNLKRLLAYSGISQMGYVLVGLAAIEPAGMNAPPFLQLGFQAALFYTAAYLFSDLAAFGVVTYLSTQGHETVTGCRGLASKFPAIAFVFLLAILSLAGIPPLVGFVGKFYLFAAAFAGRLYWLVILALVNSVASLFYYLRIAKAMYLEDSEGQVEKRGLSPYPLGTVPTWTVPTFLPMQVVLFLTSFAIIAIGVFPRLIVDSAQSALQRFLAPF